LNSPSLVWAQAGGSFAARVFAVNACGAGPRSNAVSFGIMPVADVNANDADTRGLGQRHEPGAGARPAKATPFAGPRPYVVAFRVAARYVFVLRLTAFRCAADFRGRRRGVTGSSTASGIAGLTAEPKCR
jgi:hypothetical protein